MSTKPIIAQPTRTLSQAVHSAAARTLKMPSGVKIFNTNMLSSLFFHCVIFGATNSGKTLTAAQFGGPEKTRIINTRNESQLITLQGLGYQGVTVSDFESFQYAALTPELLWPDWAEFPDRVLVLDDITEGAEGAIEENKTTDSGAEIKNTMLVFRGVKTDLREIFRTVMRAPQHVILTALARTGRDNIDGSETITPDLPPSIYNMMGAEIEYGFFLDREKKQIVTDTEIISVKDPIAVDPSTRQPLIHRRKIFAKYKQAADGSPRKVGQREPMDLAAIWQKIQAAKGEKT